MDKRLRTTFWIWAFAGTNLLWISLVVAAFFYRSVRDRRDYVNAPESNPQYEDRMNLFSLADQRWSGPVDVLFLGDSHTQRGLFSEFYPDLRVVNRGIGSDTTDGILLRIDEALKFYPKKLVLLVGGNDRGFGASVDHYMQNVGKIVDRIKRISPKTKIAVVSPMPASEPNEWQKKVHHELKEFANVNNVEYIGVYDEFSRGGGESKTVSISIRLDMKSCSSIMMRS